MPNLATIVGNVMGDSGINAIATTSGTSGINGTQGVNGTSGNNGSSNISGIAGTSGTTGASTSSGTSGSLGTNGVSTASALSGSSGTSGRSGTSGTSGSNGVGGSGSNGTSGVSGGGGTFSYNNTAIVTDIVFWNSNANTFQGWASDEASTASFSVNNYGLNQQDFGTQYSLNIPFIYVDTPYPLALGYLDYIYGGLDLYVSADGYFTTNYSTLISKTNIETLTDVSWLSRLIPCSFNYRKKDEDGNYTNDFDNTLKYGLIADEAELVNDNIVFYDTLEDGSKKLAGVEYNKLIAPMLLRIQQLEKELEILESI